MWGGDGETDELTPKKEKNKVIKEMVSGNNSCLQRYKTVIIVSWKYIFGVSGEKVQMMKLIRPLKDFMNLSRLKIFFDFN